jgi:hypothetical protein
MPANRACYDRSGIIGIVQAAMDPCGCQAKRDEIWSQLLARILVSKLLLIHLPPSAAEDVVTQPVLSSSRGSLVPARSRHISNIGFCNMLARKRTGRKPHRCSRGVGQRDVRAREAPPFYRTAVVGAIRRFSGSRRRFGKLPNPAIETAQQGPQLALKRGARTEALLSVAPVAAMHW